MYSESSYPLAHALIHFPYEIFLIWISFCRTFSYYFDETLNPAANSSCVPCSGVKLDITQHVVSLYGGCVVFSSVFSSRISLEIKITSALISPAIAWATNQIPDENPLGVFHRVSHCIHVIKSRASYWRSGTWIINECEKPISISLVTITMLKTVMTTFKRSFYFTMPLMDNSTECRD